jgi:pimeloyl-ACP methyl ester carboxylesterase
VGPTQEEGRLTEAATFVPAEPDAEPYDEFTALSENAAEMGVALGDVLPGTRATFTRSNGQVLSYIRWGPQPAELVFLHGGGQNAHTWDSVVVALGRPALAVDLPGHGHSDRRADGAYGPSAIAEAVAELIAARASGGVTVVGMSLGGTATIRLAAQRPDLVRRAVIVDVSPSTNDEGRAMTPEQRGTVALIGGPPTFDSLEEVIAATAAAAPGRAEAAIRRGVRHNMYRLADGRWRWRYDLGNPSEDRRRAFGSFAALWDDVAAIVVPVMLVIGGASVFVLPEDVAEYRRRLPTIRVETVAGSGHSVQSDAPAELVAVLAEFLS